MKPFLRIAFLTYGSIAALILLWASFTSLSDLIQVYKHPEIYHPESIQHHYKNHIALGFLHIVPGMLFILLGGYQFIPYFRNDFKKTHRRVGKIFLTLSAVISISAIILAIYYPFGNMLETLVTLVFGSYLLFATNKAYYFAKKRKIYTHINWVARVYFVALSVSTIRGIIALFMAFGNYTLKEAFGISFLLAFLLHFFLVEIWIRYLNPAKIE